MSYAEDDGAPLANVLISVPYFSADVVKTLVPAADRVRLVIDSGAFTAWKAGKVLDLDSYCRFLETLPVRPWRYFTLDVVGDPAATLRNYQTMLARGFTPVPIFTRGEDPAMLDQYYQTTDLVGIGGLVGTQNNKGFVNGIMRHVGTRRVHWLGFTNLDYLRAYRPYMCDSSSWEYGARVGSVKLYMGHGRSTGVTRKSFAERRNELVCNRIRTLGLEPTSLLRGQNWHGDYSVNRRLCGASYLALSLDVQKHLGTLMFLALATPTALRIVIEAYDFQQQRGIAA